MARIISRKENERRRMRFQVFAGMFDFLAILVGLAVAAVCIFILVTLYHWVIREGAQSFRSLWYIFESALIIPE